VEVQQKLTSMTYKQLSTRYLLDIYKSKHPQHSTNIPSYRLYSARLRPAAGLCAPDAPQGASAGNEEETASAK